MAARSQRNRGSKTVHFPKAPEELFNQNGRWLNDADQPLFRIKPICGEEFVHQDVTTAELPEFRYSEYQSFSTDPEDYRMCSRCQAKALQKRDGGKVGTYKLMDRLDFSQPEHERKYVDGKLKIAKWGLERHAWKSVYPVMDTAVLADEEHDKIVGFIVIDNGWGKAWQIHGWDSGRETGDPPRMSSQSSNYTRVSPAYGSTPEREMKMDARGINSKEMALLLIPDMVARGHLKPYRHYDELAKKLAETQEALRVRRLEEVAERDRLRAEQHQRDAEEKTEIAEALREIAETVTLTNFQRDGLMRAAKRLGIDMEVKSTMAAVMVDDEDGWKI